MQIELWLVGKNDPYVSDNFDLYKKRLGRYTHFSATFFQENRTSNLLSRLKPADLLILLDEKGKQLSSPAFADFIHKQMVMAKKKMVFFIGGAYGFQKEIYSRADQLLSLSSMTLSHQVARVVFMEQLYRAYTIINNEPYHHA